MWWCGGGFFTDYNTTPTKVVLSCFGLLVGLWQYIEPVLNWEKGALEFYKPYLGLHTDRVFSVIVLCSF